MKIAEIKDYAWNHMSENIGFDFNGKHISYPWLDEKTQSVEINTVEAIMTYGYENMRDFCKEVAPLCRGNIPTIFEWVGDPTCALDTIKWAYEKWLEKDVLFVDGKIVGLSI